MTRGVFVAILLLCIIAGLLAGCGSPGSKMLGHWVDSKEPCEINISKNGDAYNVEMIMDGQSSKLPGTYKDGILTIQNTLVIITFQHDEKTDELIANTGGQEVRMHRQ